MDIGMYIVLGTMMIVAVIIMVGCVLDFVGYYDKEENQGQYLDNSEYDYGHNVNHKAEE